MFQRLFENVWSVFRLVCGVCFVGTALACTPTVQVAPPTEPITINLNVKIDHEVKVKVDRDLDKVLSEESDLF